MRVLKKIDVFVFSHDSKYFNDWFWYSQIIIGSSERKSSDTCRTTTAVYGNQNRSLSGCCRFRQMSGNPTPRTSGSIKDACNFRKKRAGKKRQVIKCDHGSVKMYYHKTTQSCFYKSFVEFSRYARPTWNNLRFILTTKVDFRTWVRERRASLFCRHLHSFADSLPNASRSFIGDTHFGQNKIKNCTCPFSSVRFTQAGMNFFHLIIFDRKQFRRFRFFTFFRTLSLWDILSIDRDCTHFFSKCDDDGGEGEITVYIISFDRKNNNRSLLKLSGVSGK